jgi:LemA protein
MAAQGQGAQAASGAEQRLADGLGRLLAVAEAYPALKASANFLALQQELANTEDRIQAARRFYNGNVRDFRNQAGTFPGSIWSGRFPPTSESFFEAEPSAAAVPQLRPGLARAA